MTRSRTWLLAAIAVIVVLAVAGSLATPTGRVARAARGGVAPVLASGLVCPSVAGGPGGRTTDMTVAHAGSGPVPVAAYTPVFGASSARHAVPVALKPAVVVRKSSPYGAVAVAAAGPGAAGVVASQASLIPYGPGRGLSDLTCLPPGTDWWFVGADGRVGTADLIFLVNPADAPANLAISFWSSRGPLSPPRASGIIVPAHSTVLRRVSEFAPDVAGVAMRVHADSGTISAGVVDLESSGTTPTGSDSLPPTIAPTRSSVVTGFMPGASYDRLDLMNPGDRDATVSLRLLTVTKNFVPAGHQTVVVPAGHTTSVDLSAAISGESAAAVISSDLPVSAAAVTAQRPSTGFRELAWLPAQQALAGPAGIAGNVPPFNQKVNLILTAPEATAKVRLDTSTGAGTVITVPAGRTVNVDLRATLHAGAAGPGPLLLTPLDAPVYAVRTLYAIGDHGPLMAAAAPMVLPKPVDLPPVVPDPRAALP